MSKSVSKRFTMSRKKNVQDELEFKIDDMFHLESAISQVFNGDERTIGVLGGSLVDNSLEYALKFHFAGDQKTIDSLFSISNQLGTFSSRINLSFAMGIVGSITHKNMDAIREVRNAFAHQILMISHISSENKSSTLELKPVSFRTREIVSWCNSLKDMTGWNVFSGDESPKEKYMKMCKAICLGLLYGTKRQLPPVAVPDSIDYHIEYHTPTEAEALLIKMFENPSSIRFDQFGEYVKIMESVPIRRLREIADQAQLRMVSKGKGKLIDEYKTYIKSMARLNRPNNVNTIKTILP
jgi:hypothetical protein